MTKHAFTLIPFYGGHRFFHVQIAGYAERLDSALIVTFTLEGDISDLMIPELAGAVFRSDNLWEHTCAEFFIAAHGCDCYWEFNISPAGHWNVYRFESYRHAMIEEPRIASLPFTCESTSHRLLLQVIIDLNQLGVDENDLDCGISAVTESKEGIKEYWALTHTNEKPDFHNRKSFVVKLLRNTRLRLELS